MSRDTCTHAVRPSCLLLVENTRTRKASFVQPSSSTGHSQSVSPSSRFSLLPEDFGPSSLPSATTSCRSKLEFRLSSPHHQPGKYAGIKSHSPILKLTLAVFSCKLLQDRLYSSPFFPHLLLWDEKVEAFAFFPTNIWSDCLAAVWNSMWGWPSTNWQAAPVPFHSCKRPPFLDLRLPLPGTLWLESG
jgi:hypothetical protein